MSNIIQPASPHANRQRTTNHPKHPKHQMQHTRCNVGLLKQKIKVGVISDKGQSRFLQANDGICYMVGVRCNHKQQLMKSQRSLRVEHSRQQRKKQSNSPTLASSYSEKRIWAKTYKYEPFPKELKRRLIGHKFKFSDFSDEEEDRSDVVEEEDEMEVVEKKKLLPHFKIMSDRGEFVGTRSRVRSERKCEPASPRCKSVESLRLPQVVEEKKEEEEQGLGRSKLPQFKDRNQFNTRSHRNSETNSLTDKESLELNYHAPTAVPQRIIENQNEQTKSDKLRNDKSPIANQLQKLIVDEIDQRRPKKEQSQGQIEEIIEEERQQEETDNVNRLRISLEKLQQENQYLTKSKEEWRVSDVSQRSSECKEQEKPHKLHHNGPISEHHHENEAQQ